MFSRTAVSVASTVVLFVALSAPLAAQELTIGVKGGGNVSDLSIHEGTGSLATDTRTGFAGGLFAQIGIGDIFAIRPEGLLSQRGARRAAEGMLFDASLDYVEVPVLFLARIPTGGAFRPYALAGPVVSFETGCELEIEGLNGPVRDDCATFDPEDPLLTKGTEVGVAFGGGIEFARDRLVFLLDGRYNLGLTDINDVEDAPESFKNRTWSFAAGVGVRIN